MAEKDDPRNRSLTGKEQAQERITVKKLEIQKEKIGLEKQLKETQIRDLQLDIEIVTENIGQIQNRIEQGKKLINGAKLKDIFPEEKNV